jgi:hypothetical protein
MFCHPTATFDKKNQGTYNEQYTFSTKQNLQNYRFGPLKIIVVLQEAVVTVTDENIFFIYGWQSLEQHVKVTNNYM